MAEADHGGAATIVAHIPNLFDRSRFSGQAVFVETAEEARALHPTLLLVDLDRCDDVEGFAIDGVSVIGFGPHVDTDLHRRASEAGYDEILARSVFFRRLPDLLAGR
ncbi:MAG: hypothetical protein AAGA93_11025 [Actinomycetota bacterium]